MNKKVRGKIEIVLLCLIFVLTLIQISLITHLDMGRYFIIWVSSKLWYVVNSVFFQTVAIGSGIYFAYKGVQNTNETVIRERMVMNVVESANRVYNAHTEIDIKIHRKVVDFMQSSSNPIGNLNGYIEDLPGNIDYFCQVYNEWDRYVNIYPGPLSSKVEELGIFLLGYLGILYSSQKKLKSIILNEDMELIKSELDKVSSEVDIFSMKFKDTFESINTTMQKIPK